MSAEQNDAGIVLRVTDRGIGITAENQASLLDGLFHTEETDLYSTKRPFEFGAGGKGLELLRIKHYAERYGFDARGVDVNRRLPDGRTPLFAAAESGELRVVNALLERGARVNDLVLDDTALDAAEQNSHQPAARVLHAHGARRARKTASGHVDSP